MCSGVTKVTVTVVESWATVNILNLWKRNLTLDFVIISLCKTSKPFFRDSGAGRRGGGDETVCTDGKDVSLEICGLHKIFFPS